MVEITLTLPLLLMLVLALIEMGIVFASYMSLVNAAREGAFFASTCPDLLDDTKDASTSCTSDINKTNLEMYRDRVNGEIVEAVANQLVGGGLQEIDSGCTDPDPSGGVGAYLNCLRVDRPISGVGPTGTNITVTVHYRVHTFSSDVSLPGVGRFGLPNYYQMDYSIGVPLRSGQ